MNKKITVASVMLANMIAVCNLKNFPIIASGGNAILPLVLLGALLFLLPVAFVSAELTSGWPNRGVYSWVKEALGQRFGFVAVWLQWANVLFFFPTFLSSIAISLAYFINPSLALSPVYIALASFSIFWVATIINLFDRQVSERIGSVLTWGGLIIPTVLIIIAGVYWVLAGHASTPLLRSSGDSSLFSAFAGVIFCFVGIEMSAVHAGDDSSSAKTYAKGICFASVGVILLSTCGALSIAIILPDKETFVAQGVMEAFSAIFNELHMPWAIPVIALTLFLGAFGMLSAWVIGPLRGLQTACVESGLPSLFCKLNRKGMPIGWLMIQAVIVSLISMSFLFLPSLEQSYWLLLSLTVDIYMGMYLLLFIAALVLHYKQPDVVRSFRIPFGKVGIWTVCSFGLASSLFGAFSTFIPTNEMSRTATLSYWGFLLGTTALFFALPLLLIRRKRYIQIYTEGL